MTLCEAMEAGFFVRLANEQEYTIANEELDAGVGFSPSPLVRGCRKKMNDYNVIFCYDRTSNLSGPYPPEQWGRAKHIYAIEERSVIEQVRAKYLLDFSELAPTFCPELPLHTAPVPDFSALF